jgi:hypothetical protein
MEGAGCFDGGGCEGEYRRRGVGPCWGRLRGCQSCGMAGLDHLDVPGHHSTTLSRVRYAVTPAPPHKGEKQPTRNKLNPPGLESGMVPIDPKDTEANDLIP